MAMVFDDLGLYLEGSGQKKTPSLCFVIVCFVIFLITFHNFK